MKPTFTLFYTESVNSDKDSVCRVVIVPVVDGVVQEEKSFIVNPEAEFDITISGIEESEILSAPLFGDEWEEIQECLKGTPVCASEGNSAKCLCGTTERLGLPMLSRKFYNSKAICRRALDEVSYSLDYLSRKMLGSSPDEADPEEIARAWAEITVKALEPADDADIPSFADRVKIKPGIMSSVEYVPSVCIRIRPSRETDLSDTVVNAIPEHPFFGLNVVFTGKLMSMSREDARRAVIYVGGAAPERLTKETNFLVVGNQDLRVVGEKGLSGKMKKAADYKAKGCDIEIINETEFIELLQQVHN